SGSLSVYGCNTWSMGSGKGRKDFRQIGLELLCGEQPSRSACVTIIFSCVARMTNLKRQGVVPKGGGFLLKFQSQRGVRSAIVSVSAHERSRHDK
ncbi:MAG: hypothetical protein ABIU05_27025, partial [Nitrospirales bacterium]